MNYFLKMVKPKTRVVDPAQTLVHVSLVDIERHACYEVCEMMHGAKCPSAFLNFNSSYNNETCSLLHSEIPVANLKWNKNDRQQTSNSAWQNVFPVSAFTFSRLA